MAFDEVGQVRAQNPLIRLIIYTSVLPVDFPLILGY